jgi:hypothetical protein
MKTLLLLQHRFRWIQMPAAILLLLLQRTPVLRALLQTESVWECGAGDLLKSAFALAALGTYNSVAGATTFSVTSSSGTVTGAPKGTFTVSGTVGTAINGATGVTFSVSGAPGTPKSFGVTDNASGMNYTNTLPPGLSLNPATGTTTGGAPYYNSSLKGTIAGTPTTAGTYTVRCLADDTTNLSSGGNFAYIVVTFTITGSSATAPSITSQPANVTVTAGSSASFSVTASGTGTLTYQWQKGGANISGAMGSTYSIASAQAADAGNYTVVVTNSAGSVTSNAATLTVNAATSAPAITAQPQNVTTSSGSSASFSVTATGNPTPTYQWQKGGANISGATSATYTIASVQSSDAGNYTVVVTNSAGTVTSSAASLTVSASAVAPSIATQPASVTVTAGSAASFSVAANGTGPLSYQWQKGGANISGATSSTYSIASVQNGDAGSYTVVVTNSAGTVTSSAATLTVSAAATAPAITTQPANQTVTAGSAVTFSVTATGTATLTYQWKKGGANITGATSSSYSIASAQAADAGTYTVVVSNSAGNVTSNGATLTVNAASSGTAPAIVTTPTSQTVVTGHNVSFYASATGNPPATYQWQVSTDGGATWANVGNNSTYSGATTNTLTVSGAGSSLSSSQYRFVATNSAGSVTSSAFTLTVGSAVFPSPNGVAVDSAGNLWVSDSSANTIEKVTPLGVATLVAGTSGQQGSTDGAGTAALFRQPGGVVMDSAGNVYVADTGNSIIRKITATGTVSTYAGSTANQGFKDGTGTGAWFNAPAALTIDAGDNLYVADTGNSVIRKVTPSGVVTTVAGTAGTRGAADGTGTTAQFNQPAGIAIDSAGTLYVADTVNQTIRKVTTAGVVSTWVGLTGVSGTSDGTGSAALFNLPAGLTRDAAGNLYVADSGNAAVRVVTPAGVVSTLAGLNSISGFMDGSGNAAWFNLPKDVKYDGSGNLFVADNGNAAIRKVTLAGSVTTLVVTQSSGSSSGSSGSTGGGSTGGGTTSGSSASSGKAGAGSTEAWFVLTLLALGLSRAAGRRRR